MTWQQSCERGISRVTDTDIRKASTLMIMITIAMISRCFYSASSSSAFPETWMLNYARDWVASDTLTNIPCVLLPLHHNCHHHHAASQYCHRHHIISYDNRGHSFSCHILLTAVHCTQGHLCHKHCSWMCEMAMDTIFISHSTYLEMLHKVWKVNLKDKRILVLVVL